MHSGLSYHSFIGFFGVMLIRDIIITEVGVEVGGKLTAMQAQ